jgi:heme o synthase
LRMFVNSSEAVANEKAWIGSALLDLVKIRLTSMVALTTVAGFYAASSGAVDYLLMLHAIIGTGLVASGAAALNQLIERDYDALMPRTQNRPLPSGRLQPERVLAIGGFASVFGLAHLLVFVNGLTSVLAAVTLVIYLLVYTPLKRFTSLNTAVGALPGALPPLIGWSAARGEISVGGWLLFAILFFWQLPHFLAISWMYRGEYSKAGFVMLSGLDSDGSRTGLRAVLYTAGLLAISLGPFLFGMCGWSYFAGALLLGTLFQCGAVQFFRRRNTESARKLFLISVLYLPLLLGLMVGDKIR